MKSEIAEREWKLMEQTLKEVSKFALGPDLAEIGIRKGGTTQKIIKCLESMSCEYFFYGVDIDKRSSDFWKGSERAKLIIGSSCDAAELIPDGSLSWCLIDADHSYKAVCADIDAYLPKMDGNSFLLFHDTGLWDNIWFDIYAQFGVLKALQDKAGMLRSAGFRPYLYSEQRLKPERERAEHGIIIYKRG